MKPTERQRRIYESPAAMRRRKKLDRELSDIVDRTVDRIDKKVKLILQAKA